MNQIVRPDIELIFPLESGDHLDQKTFHARYEATPSRVRAELIGGIVFMPSPLKPQHGTTHCGVLHWLRTYQYATPGTRCFDNTTAILGEESEPQPDAYLIVKPENGGQMKMNADEYLEGAPELIAEVSLSSESIDLHRKKDDYELNGVQEYIVFVLRNFTVKWFVRRGGRFEELAAGADGVYRSEAFPGLWLDPASLFAEDGKRITEVLSQGLATPEHAAFTKKLTDYQLPQTS